LKRIRQRNERVVVLAIELNDLGGLPEVDISNGCLWCAFREDRAAIVKEDEQISETVVVAVDDRPSPLVGGRVEFLDQIDLAIEIAIRFAAQEHAVRVVILLDVGAPVEIAVDRNLSETSLSVVSTPLVRPAVAIAILNTNVLPVSRDREDGRGRTDRQREKRGELSDSEHRQKPQ
jgi:hypothetical protein